MLMRTNRNVIMHARKNDKYQTMVQILRESLPAAVAGLFLLAGTAADAEEGTLAQRNACKPDVFRLCSNFIPDPTAITSCLERNRAKLSPACQAVFAPSPK